ncbi:MAG: endonuclease domain-containing protein [Candidatus Cloacimonadota bacterium]|nr:endonuclease domain-containing protein [Candidatus Cloacimonadota bacterium]
MSQVRTTAIQTARDLRQKTTKAESTFWEVIRNRKIDNYKFNRQFPIYFEYEEQERFFIADFYCHKRRLIIEIDGGIHEQQKDYDMLRTEIINKLGFKVIRFSNEFVMNNLSTVIAELKRNL